MNNTFSPQQLSRNSNLDANLISRLYKLKLLADFVRMEYKNPKLKQSKIANQLGYSSSTLQKHRNYMKMISLYRIQPITNNKQTKKLSKNNFENNPHPEHDLKKTLNVAK